jgi:hypothetical protein
VTWSTTEQSFDIPSGSIGRYRYYKLEFNASSGNGISIYRLKMYAKMGAIAQRYTFDYVFDTFSSSTDIEKLIAQSFNGKLIKSQGTWKPVWLHSGTSSFSFTKDNIEQGSFSSGEDDAPNLVRITYRNRARDFSQDTIEVRDDHDIYDRGEIVFEEKCDWITDREAALRRGKFQYDYKRLCTGYVKLKCGQYASGLEEYDIVDVTHPRCIEDGKLYFVEEIKEDNYGVRTFTLREYSSEIFSGKLASNQNPESETDDGQESSVPDSLDVTNASTTQIPGGVSFQWGIPDTYGTESFLISHRCRDQSEALAWSDWSGWTEVYGSSYSYQLTASEISTYGSDAKIEFKIKVVDIYGNVGEESDSIAITAQPASGKKPFAIEGNGTDYNPDGISIGQKFVVGSTELFANGRHWTLRSTETESPDIWDYEEITDGGEYTKVRPRSEFTIGQEEPVVIKFIPA